jgi:hypothetical protein
VRPHAVIVIPPGADDDVSLFQAGEDLQLQALVPELAVEALTVPVLSEASAMMAWVSASSSARRVGT